MLEIRYAAANIRRVAPELTDVIANLENAARMAKESGLYSTHLREIEKEVEEAGDTIAPEGSLLSYRRIGLEAHRIAVGGLNLPDLGTPGAIDGLWLPAFEVDGTILSAYTERRQGDFAEMPPTVLTIVVQTVGVSDSKLRYKTRKDVPIQGNGNYAISIDIDPIHDSFGNTWFRNTRLSRSPRMRVPSDMVSRFGERMKSSIEAQGLGKLLLDRLSSSTPLDSQLSR
jgi:hypothetical protein